MCTYAAMHGHLEVLKWLRDNDCPLNLRTSSCAAEGGHLDVLKWLRDNGCPWDDETRQHAAERWPEVFA